MRSRTRSLARVILGALAYFGARAPSWAYSALAYRPEDLKKSQIGTRMTIIASAPAKDLEGVSVLEYTREAQRRLSDKGYKIANGYDWNGSALSKPGDGWSHIEEAIDRWAKDGDIEKFERVLVGTPWFEKYRAGLMKACETELQRQDVSCIDVLCIGGGPISQVEQRQMPRIIEGIKHNVMNNTRGNELEATKSVELKYCTFAKFRSIVQEQEAQDDFWQAAGFALKLVGVLGVCHFGPGAIKAIKALTPLSTKWWIARGLF